MSALRVKRWYGGGFNTALARLAQSLRRTITASPELFLPVACLRVLRSLKDKYGKLAWGRYGFCDAFDADENWYGPNVLGIDVGISVLMAENLRTGFVWETFKRNREIPLAMKRAGFKST